MTHAPMTYVFRSYCPANEPAKFGVYFCNKNGDRTSITFDSPNVAKAFAEALNALGFTKKRR